MSAATHLKSLQALEMAIREGSLKGAAERLGITPAAVGQRIRALEDYLGTDLLVRGRSGLHPTVELDRALSDLKLAFGALDRVTETLDFQRVSEIHVVAEPDWAELWLMPRLPAFREEHPNILFCINGEGDVRLRLGAPDLRIAYGGPDKGEALFTDLLIPVCSHDNMRRLGDWDAEYPMEGMPLLHLVAQRDDPDHPGWPDWFERFGRRRTGFDRGPHYRHARIAMEAVRKDVGFLLAGLALVKGDLDAGSAMRVFKPHECLTAPCAYRLWQRAPDTNRPQLGRFVDWLKAEARGTAHWLQGQAAVTSSSALR